MLRAPQPLARAKAEIHLPHSHGKIALRGSVTAGILAGYFLDHGLGYVLGITANLAWIWFDAD